MVSLNRRDILKLGLSLPFAGSLFGKSIDYSSDEWMANKILNWYGPCCVFTDRWKYLNCWGDLQDAVLSDRHAITHVHHMGCLYYEMTKTIYKSRPQVVFYNGIRTRRHSPTTVLGSQSIQWDEATLTMTDISLANHVIFTVYGPSQWSTTKETSRLLYRRTNGRWHLQETSQGLGVPAKWKDV